MKSEKDSVFVQYVALASATKQDVTLLSVHPACTAASKECTSIGQSLSPAAFWAPQSPGKLILLIKLEEGLFFGVD